MSLYERDTGQHLKGKSQNMELEDEKNRAGSEYFEKYSLGIVINTTPEGAVQAVIPLYHQITE
jgi:hypothetical protein